MVLGGVGKILLHRRRFQEAVPWLEQAMNDASTSLKMLKVAERASLESGAISYYQRALNLAKEMKDPVKVANWTFNLRLAYAKLVERR
jgi:hypothetical protein